MPPTEDFLADLHSRKPYWSINIYVIMLWEVPSKNNAKETWFIEMIIEDSKGDRMHAVLPRALFKMWKDVLKEFQMYNMKWLIVSEDKQKSKITVTDVVVTISNKTRVTPVVNPSFPLPALRLRSIHDILVVDRIDEAELFDVVAVVVGREDPRDMLSKQGKELKRLAIIVEDIEKNRMNCALFDQHVEAIMPYLDETREEPLIVVLHYFKATRWNGKTSIQSNFLTSKVHINPELDEVRTFRERLMNGGLGASSRISHVSSQGAASAINELSQPNTSVMKIEEVINCDEEFKPWIAGGIMAVNNGVNDWYYPGCGKCGKKVEVVPEGRYECAELN